MTQGIEIGRSTYQSYRTPNPFDSVSTFFDKSPVTGYNEFRTLFSDWRFSHVLRRPAYALQRIL